ncbi:aspartate aminotransferase family protein [Micromonospora profundi]|uniref:aminotransferase family protein n=1 Tax=Micromonospora profundi TaxID=1420889 RepID=UPI003657AC7C
MGETSRVLPPDLRTAYPRATRAAGCYLYDDQGREYLDGCSSAIVVNVGHGNPEILDAIRAQLETITYCYRTQFANEPAERLAAELVRLAPGDLSHVQFTNSGSEGTEAAIRLALQYWQEVGRPGRRLVVSRDVSYHGATLGALAVSGHESRRRPLAALLPDMPRAPRADCNRCPFGLTRDTCALDCASAVERTILAAGPENVAAFIVEPVVGAAGGAVPAPPGYLTAVAEICRRHDVLLIADEVMTGLGRTGRWFGVDVESVAPDLLVLGKGMSAGYLPIGAVLVNARIHAAIHDGSGTSALGHTYSANPLAAASAAAVVDFLVRHDVPARAARAGDRLRRGLTAALAARGVVADVRGAGLLLGVDFTARHPGQDPGVTAAAMAAAAFEERLLLYPAGTDAVPRAVIVAPPLTITDAELDQLVDRFAAALDRVVPGADRRST